MAIELNSNQQGSSLRVVNISSSEHQSKLQAQLSNWMDTLSQLGEKINSASSDYELLSESGAAINVIENKLRFKVASHLVAIENEKGQIQAVGLFAPDGSRIESLATAPANLKLKEIQFEVTPIRGAGTLLVREAMRIAQLYKHQCLRLVPFERAKDFYVHLGFVPNEGGQVNEMKLELKHE